MQSRLQGKITTGKRGNSIFRVSATFIKEQLGFSPSVSEIKQMLGQRLSDGIEMICARPTLADHVAFKQYMSTLATGDDEEQFNPVKEVSDLDELLQKKAEIASAVDSAFCQLEAYGKEIEPFIKIYHDHTAKDFSKLEKESDAVYRRWVDEFEKDRVTITEKLQEEKYLGILLVDAYNLKQIILKKPKESREQMEKLIPEHSDKIVNRLTDLMREIEGKLGTVLMDDVDEYVVYRKFLEEHRRNSDDYEAELLKAKALHGILHEYQMRITVKRKKDLDSLDVKWKTVKEKLRAAYENCEKYETTMKSKLMKKTPEIKEKIRKLLTELNSDRFYIYTDTPEIILEELKSMVKKIEIFEDSCNKIVENSNYMNISRDEFKEIETLKEKHRHLFSFWKDQLLWSEKRPEWYKTPITSIDINGVRKIITEMTNTALNAENILRTNFEMEFKISIEFQAKYLHPMLSALDIIENIMKDTVLPRHWKRIQMQIGCNFEIKDPKFIFEVLVEIIQKGQKTWAKDNKLGYSRIEDWIRSVANQAMQEYKLENDYKKIKMEWKILYLNSKQVGESKIWQLEEPEKRIEMINVYMVNLQKILGNQYAAPLSKKAEKLYKNISLVEEILDEMILAEKKLRIVDELLRKEEFKGVILGNKFDEAHKEWKKYVKNQSHETLNQRYIKVEKSKNTALGLFQALNKNIDGIMYELESKIEEKQEECPRLFFLPSKEYIRVLINSQDTSKKLDVVTYAMQKCFASVKEILTVVENDETFPIGVISMEGEELRATMKAKNKITDTIEKVFPAMEELFKKELRTRLKAYLADYSAEKKTRSELILSTLSQVAMMAEREIFTGNTEIVIEEEEGYEDNMRVYFEEQCVACSDTGKLLTQSVSLGAGSNQPLSEVQRMSISGLIVQYVHFRDIIDFLINNETHGANSFHWQIQLRNYRLPDGSNVIKQMDAMFEYGWEYLGVRNTSPITPNVERCWLSYTSALKNKFWSTVVGPPDYGKQYTIQDLASILGKFFFLYVCNRDTTARVLEKLLMGTVYSFGWTVFEKANELQYGVLSAFAYHLLNLRQKLLEESNEWQPIKGKTISLIPKSVALGVNTPYSGLFLLVDNTSENKIGVPHTIKYMFRPVAITVLDLAALSESFLCSVGFKEARMLGYKLAFFLSSAKEILSIEAFSSDFGWRTLSTIVKTAAEIKRKNMETKNENQIIFLAIQALFRARMSEPSLTNIEKIAHMIFAGTTDNKKELQEDLDFSNEIIEKARNILQIQFDLDITQKLGELSAAFSKKFAVILVGEAACGKSMLTYLFRECINLQFEYSQEKCDFVKIFPKSFTQPELYGRYESREWIEGIFVHILQSFIQKKNKKCYSVLHCDGPLDPQWAEQLQAGFDAEKKISLSNGDFIFLNNNIKVLFEVEDLKQASPSLVSRSSIIYMQNDIVTPRNILSYWMLALKKKIKCFDIISETLTKGIDELFYNGLTERSKISKIKEEEIRLPPNVIALTFCQIFEATLLKLMPSVLEKEKRDENMKKLVGKTFVFSLAWALGGSLSSLVLKKIEDFIDSEAGTGDKPKDKLCFDAFLRISQGVTEWVPWAEYKIPYENPANGLFTQIIVPTNQLMRYFWFVDTLASRCKNIMLFGESGSGKSLVAAHSLMQDALPNAEEQKSTANQDSFTESKKSENPFKQINVCFTWHTTPGKFQKLIEERLDKKRKNLFSAPTRKKVVLYIDDVNIPQEDGYGVLPVVEYLRGILDKHSYLDKNKYFWKSIRKTSIFCSASPAYCGRKELSLRFYRHFCTFYMNTTSITELHSLFDPILMDYFSLFPREVIGTHKIGYLESLLEIYDKIKIALPGCPRNPHYVLTAKDIGKIVAGFLLGNKDTITSSEQLYKLFLHECMRVYQDRYNTEEHKALFVKEIDKIVEIKLDPKWKVANLKLCAFTNLTTEHKNAYLEVTEWQQIQKILILEQEDFNKEPDIQRINLVFFKEAVEYILKVSRILMFPKGHLISISPQALGRRSLIDLTSYMLSFDFKILDYNMRDFPNKCKKVFGEIIKSLESGKAEGVKGIALMIKVGESRIDSKRPIVEYEQNTEIIMDDISHILSTSDFSFIGESMRGDIVRNNLHIILNIPNEMDDVWRKIRMYPCLFSECYILYQECWSVEASSSIAQTHLIINNDYIREIKTKIGDAIVQMQKIVELEIQRVKTEEGKKIVIAPGLIKEITQKFVEIYEQKRQALERERNDIEKAIENVENIVKLEAQFLKENSDKKPEAEKLRADVDNATATCTQLE